jgi:inhibitor of cysteine peptidase
MPIRVFCAVIVLIASVFLLCSCSEPIELGFHDKGSSIELEKGEEIVILLDSNPTTGYSWIPGEEIDTNIVTLTDSKFIQTETEKELVGSGGREVFTFEAKNSGQTEIILYYQRPWEKAELKDEFIFNIEVTVK